MKKIVGLFSILMVITILSGCNTVNGAGRDIKGAGQWMEDTF